MAINWKVRLRNADFWMSIIPLVILTVQNMARVFGVEIDLGEKTDQILAAVTPLLSVLVLIGCVNDPTVATLGDSPRALGYDEPYHFDVNQDGKVDSADIEEILKKLEEIEAKS